MPVARILSPVSRTRIYNIHSLSRLYLATCIYNIHTGPNQETRSSQVQLLKVKCWLRVLNINMLGYNVA